jgi:Flp pilus assembly protein TadD
LASKSNKRRPPRAPRSPASPRQPDGTTRSSRLPAAAVGVVALLAGAGVIAWLATSPVPEPPPPEEPKTAATAPGTAGPAAVPPHAAPRFVGSAACKDCHAAEYQAWQGSQHDRAMQHATAATVLGDFNDAVFRYAGVESRFFTRDGKFFVRTDGADGQPAEFEIKYTYGVHPLQQYLIEFPDSRIQALSITWDARPKAEGGQRWFHQYPKEKIDHRDELHWTKRAQNWNFMCADCHSTDLRKNYDARVDRFATAWAEINVGCEACHGPGSNHAAWAREKPAEAAKGLAVALDARRGVMWTIDPATVNATRSRPKSGDAEIEVCAQCHARRAQIAEGYHAGKPFLDHYLPSLIAPPLYHADGQQREEVYVWGSYLQSKMHAQGVTCSDCHEPHSQQLRAPGNAVCAQCHLPAKYDAPTHHFHAAGEPGSRCVDCHMPATTYMVIDPRRDHSMRVPRPDLTVAIGTPNACNGCHSDKPGKWADAALRKWPGHAPQGFQTFASAFDAATRGSADAGSALITLVNDSAQPPIVRATAAQLLGGFPSTEMLDALGRGLADPDALVRLGSLLAADAVPVEQRAALVAPLLDDPRRAVRIEAARLMAPVPSEMLTPAQRAAFDAAADEFIATQNYNADRPEARTALGTFYAARGRPEGAERLLRSAIALEPRHVPAYVNLADLRRAQGRDADAEAVLREGLAANPDDASLHHALGLALVRLQRMPEALGELRRATELAPGDTRFAYVYAVGLNSTGKAQDALKEIDRALKLRPDDRELLTAGALFARDAGVAPRAAAYAKRLQERYPSDPQAAQLAREITGSPTPR